MPRRGPFEPGLVGTRRGVLRSAADGKALAQPRAELVQPRPTALGNELAPARQRTPRIRPRRPEGAGSIWSFGRQARHRER